MLFAHGVVSQNPEIFYKMFPEDFGLDPETEATLEWQIPSSEMEVQDMLTELRSTGWRGSP